MGEKKERPILFSGPMVRAILDGRKTQTRRAVDERQRIGYPHDEIERAWPSGFTTTGDLSFNWACPYGEPGDRLWVRETWRTWMRSFDLADDGDGMGVVTHQYVAYASTPRVGYRPVPDRQRVVFLDESTALDRNPELLGPWKPSIHMPRWASRLTLEVTEVRVQRLQEISEEDARAEGVQPVPFCKAGRADGMEHVEAFEDLWQSINGERPGCSWEANPWVWVVSFRRLQ